MECHLTRGLPRLICMPGRLRCLYLTDFTDPKVTSGSFQTSDKRLYHQHSRCLHYQSHLRSFNFLASPVLSKNNFLHSNRPQSRTIIISKVITAFSEAEITSLEGLSKFILGSSPVNAIRNLYEWAEAITGLPWGANILVCSFLLQLVFNVPASVYMARWMTGKEKHVADMIAVRSEVMRSPSRENIKLYGRSFTELSKQYGCERYKLFTAMGFQVLNVTMTSFGVRSLLLNSESDVGNALLPWGALLGAPDIVLPILNVIMSLLLVEVGAWRKLKSEEGLKMTFKRASFGSVPFQPEPLYLLNLRRFCSLPFIVIYTIVPSAMTLHWFVMIATSVNVQILLAHKQTRRNLGIGPCYYETDNPYKDFFHYLRNDVSIRRRKSISSK